MPVGGAEIYAASRNPYADRVLVRMPVLPVRSVLASGVLDLGMVGLRMSGLRSSKGRPYLELRIKC